jgi:hypothetical protein
MYVSGIRTYYNGFCLIVFKLADAEHIFVSLQIACPIPSAVVYISSSPKPEMAELTSAIPSFAVSSSGNKLEPATCYPI